MPQKPNILKVFLIAVFCLASLGVAGEARASTIIINPDHSISVNGVRTFPVGIWEPCNYAVNDKTINGYLYPPCSSAFANVTNFAWTIGTQMFYPTPTNSLYPFWWSTNNPLFENNHKYWTAFYNSANNSVFKTTYKNGDYFAGYFIQDEPITEADWISRTNQYNNIKANDTVHPVHFANLLSMKRSSTISDIIHYDAYFHATGSWQTYELDDFIYAKENSLWKFFIKDGCSLCTGVDDVDGSIWALTEAWGANISTGHVPLSSAKARADAFALITMGFHGIEWWGYSTYDVGWDSSQVMGIMRNPAAIAQYNALAGEIKSLESILLLPTANYSWGGYHIDNRVSFSNNPVKDTLGKSDRPYLNWMLKQDGSNYYLIVVNKDKNSVNNTEITITGLSGSMNARMLGTQTVGSSSEHKITPIGVVGGKFTDSFDGYAAHIYQICSTGDSCTVSVPPPPAPDTTLPEIAITCPTGTPTYSSNNISLSGTASDNIGVSKVEVKVGASGTYQTATGTTSWSISGLTLASGANTVYARATDAAGNTKETSIAVIYSASAVPDPASSACTKFVAKTGNDANPGTEASPWLTIQKAANMAVAGDTVCVKAGTYNEGLKPKNSGSDGKYIKFIAQGKAILDRRSFKRDLHNATVNLISKNWIWVEGFEIYPVLHERSIWTGIDDHLPAQKNYSSNIMIKNNYLHILSSNANHIHVGDYGSSWLTVGRNKNIIVDGNTLEIVGDEADFPNSNPEMISFSNTDNSEIKNNRITGSLGIGICVKGGNTNLKVHDNIIEDSATQAIYLDGYALYAGNLEVYNNYIHKIGPWVGGLGYRVPQSGIKVNLELGQGLNTPGSIEHVKIYNNIINGATYYGILVGGDSNKGWPNTVVNKINDVLIIGNTIVNSGTAATATISAKGGSISIGGGSYYPASVSNVAIRNNLMKGNTEDNIGIGSTIPNLIIENNHYTTNVGYDTGTGFTTGDPLFVSATDYHLQSTSPAINAGTSAGAPAFDFAGNKRPVGSGFDIGAYEYCVGAECVPDPSASSSSSLPPSCTAPSTPSPASLCGNGVIDPPDEVCDTLNNFGCSASSACNSDCTACTPVVVCSSKEGDPCTSKNMCGDISSPGTILCNGSCSSPIPPLDPQVNKLCSSPLNSCNQSASGYTDCNGLCKAVSPPLPLNYGKDCFSAQNQCNQSSPGKVGCNGCSAAPPAPPAGLDDGNSCTIDTCDSSGNIYHSNSCGGLIPCGRAGDNPDTPDIDESQPCTLCAFFYLLKNIINYIMTLAMGIGVFVLVLAGLLSAYSAGDQQKINLAKSALTSVIIGLVIVFLAWLLVAAVLQGLGYGSITAWNQVGCGV